MVRKTPSLPVNEIADLCHVNPFSWTQGVRAYVRLGCLKKPLLR